MVTYFPKPLNKQVAAISDSLMRTQEGLGIGASGDTHDAISSGQFVYVRDHSSLAEGLYKSTAAIAANGALSTSNLTADGSGGLNDLQSQITSLNSKLANITPQITGNTASDSNTNNIPYPTGRDKSNMYPISIGFYRNTNWVFNNSAYVISLANSNIVLELNSGFEYLRGLPYVIMYR